MGTKETIDKLIECANAWDPEVRILANVTSGEMGAALKEITRLLAESYAPCRECGGPPNLAACTEAPAGKFVLIRCLNCDRHIMKDSRDEALAAWNLAMRGEG